MFGSGGRYGRLIFSCDACKAGDGSYGSGGGTLHGKEALIRRGVHSDC
jgi:hypothetical protein